MGAMETSNFRLELMDAQPAEERIFHPYLLYLLFLLPCLYWKEMINFYFYNFFSIRSLISVQSYHH